MDSNLLSLVEMTEGLEGDRERFRSSFEDLRGGFSGDLRILSFLLLIEKRLTLLQAWAKSF